MEVVFWLCTAVLFYVYIGYLFLLKALEKVTGCRAPSFPSIPEDKLPSVTVLLTVHNEEAHLRKRLDNLLTQRYPKDKLTIVVASDGSTDETNAIAKEYAKQHNVQLVVTRRLGKSGAQNHAMASVTSDIVLLTDAQARFETNYIEEIVRPFADPKIGGVTAYLLFEARPGILADGQGYYWSYEMKLRQAESDLGLLAVMSGQAMAFRRNLFVPLPENVGDDCMVPLDIVQQGYKVVHQPAAQAYDTMENQSGREFRSRIRMTMRNWTGMWMRPRLLDPLASPGYAFALWSHKLLRWLGSFCVAVMLLCSLSLVFDLYMPAFLFICFCALATAGFAQERGLLGTKIPFAGLACGFMVANAGFFLGILKALHGKKITYYRAGH